MGSVNDILRYIPRSRLFQCRTHVSHPQSQPRDTCTYTLTISRDFKISKIRTRLPLRTVETSLVCASDYVLEPSPGAAPKSSAASCASWGVLIASVHTARSKALRGSDRHLNSCTSTVVARERKLVPQFPIARAPGHPFS